MTVEELDKIAIPWAFFCFPFGVHRCIESDCNLGLDHGFRLKIYESTLDAFWMTFWALGFRCGQLEMDMAVFFTHDAIHVLKQPSREPWKYFKV